MDSSATDDVETVRQALIRLMAIADRLESRNAHTVQRIEAATSALDQGVSRLDAGGERFAERALQLIGNNAQHVVAQGAGQAVDELRQRLQQSAGSAQAASAPDQEPTMRSTGMVSPAPAAAPAHSAMV